MSHRHALLIATALLAGSVVSGNAWAAAPAGRAGCVELKTVAEQETTVTVDGKSVKQVIPAAKVVPGDQVIWTTTARNLCDQPAENVVINQPVAEHMQLVANSASGDGTQISYSLDGKEFLPLAQLKVREPDGNTRAARADEVRHLRWTLGAPIAANSSMAVRFRAVLN